MLRDQTKVSVIRLLPEVMKECEIIHEQERGAVHRSMMEVKLCKKQQTAQRLDVQALLDSATAQLFQMQRGATVCTVSCAEVSLDELYQRTV